MRLIIRQFKTIHTDCYILLGFILRMAVVGERPKVVTSLISDEKKAEINERVIQATINDPGHTKKLALNYC